MWVCGSASAGGVGVRGPFECPQDRLRQAQGERTRGAGLRRGVGDAMGDGDALCRAPLDTGFRRYDDEGVRVGKCWRCWGAGAPFECPQDRLRQAQGERNREAALRRGVGDAMGEETPRPAPLWIPAFAGTTVGVGARVGKCWRCWGGGPPSSALRTGFDRLRANELGVRALRRGVGDAMGDGDAPRRAPLDTGFRRYDDGGVCGSASAGGVGVRGPLRQAQGERSRGAALRRGVGDAMGDGDDPRPAPLDTGFRRYDDGDVRGRQVLVWCWAGEGPAAAGRALREAPLQIERRWGLSCELEGAYN